VTCGNSDNVFRISPSGTIVEIIGAGGDGLGHVLDGPFAIAVGANGNVYVTGSNSNNAFRITPPFPGGTITQIIDASGGVAVEGTGTAPLQVPLGIAVDAAGNVFVSGATSDNVFRVEPGGAIREIIDFFGDGRGHAPCSACPLDVPHDVAVDSSGNVYVTGFVSHNTFKIVPGPAGAITEIFDFAQCLGLSPLSEGPAVDGFGNVIQSGLLSNNAVRIEPAAPLCAGVTEIIDGGGDGTHPLVQAQMVAADAAGNAYVTAVMSNNAFKIAPDGRITQCIDSTGDGGAHWLGTPFGIAVDARGNIFVTALGSANVFKIQGCGTLLCGNGSVDPGEQCDDGNRSDGDCCSAHCLFEPAGAACSDGEICTALDQCDGAGACTPGACRVGVPCNIFCGMSCQVVEGQCACVAE
jgi:cysteine-rich repeat protein